MMASKAPYLGLSEVKGLPRKERVPSCKPLQHWQYSGSTYLLPFKCHHHLNINPVCSILHPGSDATPAHGICDTRNGNTCIEVEFPRLSSARTWRRIGSIHVFVVESELVLQDTPEQKLAAYTDLPIDVSTLFHLILRHQSPPNPPRHSTAWGEYPRYCQAL